MYDDNYAISLEKQSINVWRKISRYIKKYRDISEISRYFLNIAIYRKILYFLTIRFDISNRIVSKFRLIESSLISIAYSVYCNTGFVTVKHNTVYVSFLLPWDFRIFNNAIFVVSRLQTRKLCYRKDDHAMRPIYGFSENFREFLTTPTVTIPEIFNGLLLRSILWMCV